MCGIVDASVVHEVFGSQPTEAGKKFVEWIDGGSGRLVVGGKLLQELSQGSQQFMVWQKRAALYGKIRFKDDDEVNAKTDQLKKEGSCKSNDAHIIALAQISGARLLYTDDRYLQQDFKNERLIDPQGKIYPARGDGKFRDGSFQDSHKRLLRSRDLCRNPKVNG